MPFASATRRFAAQAARDRRTLSRATIQPYTGTGAATVDGNPVSVFLSTVRVERELSDSGANFVIKYKAELRVLKTCHWQPAAGMEFVNLVTNDRFRCNTASGADSAFSAEIVCEVERIS
jgi:hypothetical protein